MLSTSGAQAGSGPADWKPGRAWVPRTGAPPYTTLKQTVNQVPSQRRVRSWGSTHRPGLGSMAGRNWKYRAKLRAGWEMGRVGNVPGLSGEWAKREVGSVGSGLLAGSVAVCRCRRRRAGRPPCENSPEARFPLDERSNLACHRRPSSCTTLKT